METNKLEGFKLVAGVGSIADKTACIMSAASILAGEPFSDSVSCVCPVVREFSIRLNDSLPDSERQKLLLVAGRLLGTKGDAALERRRAFRCADWAVRTVAADSLDKVGISHSLRELAPIVDEDTATAAANAAYAATAAAASDAAAAAYATARAAAYAAARAAARADAATAANAAANAANAAAADYANAIQFLIELCEMA
jgi:hypothetical protein